MHSRWTDFLHSDGEKSWRNRDSEFEDPYETIAVMKKAWEEAWDLVFSTLENIDEKDFNSPVFIRNEKHSIVEATNRQLGHYAYHTGQIVVIAKCILGDQWKSLSIPKGESAAFNKKMFGK